MKALLIALLFAVTAQAKSLDEAIAIVESNNNPTAIGDNGRAVGRYQIWKICVDDVNRILGYKAFTYEDRKCPVKSWKMFRIYINYYAKVYERKTGKKATDEIKARIWNGGANGWKKEATKKYWEKVKKAM